MNYSTNLDNSNSDNSNSSLTTCELNCLSFPFRVRVTGVLQYKQSKFSRCPFFFFEMFFIFIFVIFLFVFPDRWKTREICQKRIRRNTAVFMTSYIILIKLSEVQFGRNITWPRDLKIGRARSARSITNKYDCKQKLRVSRSPITTL